MSCSHSPGILLALWTGTHLRAIKSTHQGVIWRGTNAELALQAGGEDKIPPPYFLLKAFPRCRCAAAEVPCQEAAVTYRAGEHAHICVQSRAGKRLGPPVPGDYVLMMDSANFHGGEGRISQGTIRAPRKYQFTCRCQPSNT